MPRAQSGPVRSAAGGTRAGPEAAQSVADVGRRGKTSQSAIGPRQLRSVVVRPNPEVARPTDLRRHEPDELERPGAGVGPTEARRQAHQHHALGRLRHERSVRAAGDAQHRNRGFDFPGQGQDTTGDLAVEGGRVHMALTRDDQVRPPDALGQAGEPGDEVEPRLHPGAEREQPAAEAPRGARSGHGS